MYLDFDMSVWSWPQWVFFWLYVLNIVLAMVNHGAPRTGEHSLPWSVSMAAIGVFILTAGGFFGA